MSEAASAIQQSSQANSPSPDAPASRMAELKVSGHLMTLEAGLFCILQSPLGAPPADGSGLPGVRISAAPGSAGRPEGVAITTFRADGWLAGPEDAALVRVSAGPAQILVTIYQSPAHGAEQAPRLQVLRLTPEPGQAVAPGAPPVPVPVPVTVPVTGAVPVTGSVAVASGAGAAPELVAHIARAGDVTARIGEWVGVPGSKQWIEGFGLLPRDGVAPGDIEYQAVLGQGWLSPWVEGGTFCGSRGMALPLLGLRVRLRGAAAAAFECRYSATFVDGSSAGPATAGEACEADSLAPLEAFQVELRPRANGPATKRAVRSEPEPAAPAPASRTPRVMKSARRSR